jgi:DNA-binding MarR family transcriptional regulator
LSENPQKAITQFDKNELRVSLSYKDLRAEFSGTPETVLQSLVSFLAQQIPALDLARKLTLNYDVVQLAKEFQDYVKLTPEGPIVLSPNKKLSDRQLLCLQLVGQRIAFESGRTGASSSGSLSELQEKTGMIPKTLSSRLSELSKEGCVARESRPEGNSYKITTQGINWLTEDLKKKGSRS